MKGKIFHIISIILLTVISTVFAINLKKETFIDLSQDLFNAKKQGKNIKVDIVSVSNPNFSQALRITITKQTVQLWKQQIVLEKNIKIQKNDVLLLSFYIRCINGDTGQIMVQHKKPFVKGEKWEKPPLKEEISFDSEWKQIFLPYSSSKDYRDTIMQFQLGGYKPQSIEIANLKFYNFHDKYTISDLQKLEKQVESLSVASSTIKIEPLDKKNIEKLNKIKKEKPINLTPFLVEVDVKGTGIKRKIIDITNLPFSKAVQISIEKKVRSPWLQQLNVTNRNLIKKDDVLLLSLYARCVTTEDESGLGQFSIQHRKLFVTGEKWETPLLLKPINVGKKWKHFFIPYKSSKDYKMSTIQFMFGGVKPQTLEIADLKIYNFHNKYTVKELPISKETYQGMDPDAKWRKEANARIEKYRKANLQIILKDKTGDILPNATVHIKQKNHEFGFGGSINSKFLFSTNLMTNKQLKQKYKKMILDSFNKVTIENAMKWNLYELDFAPFVQPTLDWCRKNNLLIRGHTLVWPSFSRVPPRIKKLKDNPKKLRKAISQHIQEFTTKWSDAFYEWDVLNEPYTQHEFMDILGKKETIKWFKIAKKSNPSFKTYINDFAILAGNDSKHRESYYNWIQYLKSHGAPIEGIGFQSHFRAPVGMNTIWKRIKEFEKFGLAMQITEYDFDTPDEDLQAQFTKDFMTLVFSHPQMTGFITWTLLGKNKLKKNAAFYTADFVKGTMEPKKVVSIWNELIKKVWHTDSQKNTNSQGEVNFRGFKGEYDVYVSYKGKTKKYKINLNKRKSLILKF